MIEGPDTKYMMMWGGLWRPVTHMFDHGGNETAIVGRAAKAVLYVSEDAWIAAAINPGDIVERTDRNPNSRDWSYLVGG